MRCQRHKADTHSTTRIGEHGAALQTQHTRVSRMSNLRSDKRRRATILLLPPLHDRQRRVYTIQIGFMRCAPQLYTYKKGCPARNTLNYCKYYKPSSVLPKEPLSFIYDCGHPQPLATYPPDIGRATLNCRYTWSCNPQGVLPANIAATAVGSYPTFSPLPETQGVA